MSIPDVSLGPFGPEAISYSDLPDEHEQLTYCRLLSLWANEPEALFRRTEMMSVFGVFSAVRSLYKLSHTQSRMD